MIGFLHRTRTLHLRDDRGRLFPLHSPHLRLEWKADKAAVTWYRLAQVRRDSESLFARIAGWGVIGLFCAALLWFGVSGAIDGEIRQAVVLLAFVPFLAAVGMAWRQQLRAQLRRLEDERLRLAPVCPSCRYDLAGLPAEPDGCFVCAECGAAWQWSDQKTNKPID